MVLLGHKLGHKKGYFICANCKKLFISDKKIIYTGWKSRNYPIPVCITCYGSLRMQVCPNLLKAAPIVNGRYMGSLAALNERFGSLETLDTKKLHKVYENYERRRREWYA